jgi:hypothetical protein
MTAWIDGKALNALEDLWEAQGRQKSAREHFAVCADELAQHLKLS